VADFVPAARLLAARPTLLRALGRWDLTAIGVNQVIGGAVFLMPALVAAQVGAWAPWFFVAVGLQSLVIAVCFAEAASRFDETGGPYLFTRAAFGRFVSFETGWMLWYVRAASWASIINGLADALGFYWPALAGGAPRAAFITVAVGLICWVNVLGIRQSAFVVNLFTAGKLVPLLLFVVVGAFFMDAARLEPAGFPGWAAVGTTGLYVVFAYGGFEVTTVPAGEAKDPRRMVPFAIVMTIVVVTLVMTLVQVVALGTLPGLAASKTPLADAASRFMGQAGGLLLTLGAAVSMTGNNVGQALSGSRNLFALAEQGDLPAIFGRIHPRYRTPWVAIVFTSAVSLALALSGSFALLAAGSAIARLVVYAGTCASVIVMRRPEMAGRVAPARFVVPGGAAVPVLGLLLSLALMAGATRLQLLVGLGALVVGAGLYVVAVRPTSVGGRAA
jgi:APA family basic amino acid/polyamine antiporter